MTALSHCAAGQGSADVGAGGPPGPFEIAEELRSVATKGRVRWIQGSFLRGEIPPNLDRWVEDRRLALGWPPSSTRVQDLLVARVGAAARTGRVTAGRTATILDRFSGHLAGPANPVLVNAAAEDVAHAWQARHRMFPDTRMDVLVVEHWGPSLVGLDAVFAASGYRRWEFPPVTVWVVPFAVKLGVGSPALPRTVHRELLAAFDARRSRLVAACPDALSVLAVMLNDGRRDYPAMLDAAIQVASSP